LEQAIERRQREMQSILSQNRTIVIATPLPIEYYTSQSIAEILDGSATRKSSKEPTKIVETYGGKHGKERQVERRAKDRDCVSDSARRSRGK
jgi:flavorubredoxin